MTISAFDGPVIGGFPGAPLTGMPANTNPESGPSLFNYLFGLLDPRGPFTFIPGENFGKKTYGLLSGYLQTVSQVPSAKTANNIAAAQTATAGTALTLVSSNTTGITVSTSITRGDTGATVTGLLAIDTAMSGVSFGTAGTMQIWDTTKAVARNVTITCNGTDTGTYTVAGYDLYGYPMTETITGTSGAAATPLTVAGKKAFKYVTSVTPSGTINSTGVTVGTGDVFGLPVRADRQSQTLIFWGNPATLQVGNNTATAQTIVVPLTLANVQSTATFQVAVPFDGVVNSVLFRTGFPVALTTGSAALQLMVNGTTAGVTGGKITLSAAGSASSSGAITTGSTITAGNTFTAGQTIGVQGVNVTTIFAAGAGFLEFSVQDVDLGGNSTFTAADTTSPATATTGDTRGTYQPALASDGTARLVVLQAIAPGAVGTATSIFGVTQV